jgi:maltooligosyltrehalose synthase
MAETITQAAAEAEDSTVTSISERLDDEARIRSLYRTYVAEKDAIQEASSQLGVTIKEAKNDWNVNRAMFKLAAKFAQMDSAKAQQNMRDLIRYAHYLSVYDQADLFDNALNGSAEQDE